MGIKERKNRIEHIDTNILVRLITRDNERQLKRIKKLLSKKDKIYVFEDAAMMELVYVLQTTLYRYPRKLIAAKIKEVLKHPGIYCNKSVLSDTLDLYASEPKLSFVDCYLAIVTDTTKEQPLWTFDQKLLAKCPLAREP